MTEPRVTHSTFVIERALNASPARVFAAYSTLEGKSQWFKPPDGSLEKTMARDFDFREGGKERFHAKWNSGKVSDFQATYHDIIENERIVLVYDMHVDGVKLSTSVMTIELVAEDGGTRLIHTEQGAYYVGGEEAARSREEGTTFGIEAIVLLFADAASA